MYECRQHESKVEKDVQKMFKHHNNNVYMNPTLLIEWQGSIDDA